MCIVCWIQLVYANTLSLDYFKNSCWKLAGQSNSKLNLVVCKARLTITLLIVEMLASEGIVNVTKHAASNFNKDVKYTCTIVNVYKNGGNRKITPPLTDVWVFIYRFFDRCLAWLIQCTAAMSYVGQNVAQPSFKTITLFKFLVLTQLYA